MNKAIGVKSKLALAGVAMLASMGAQAVSITNPTITGTYLVNEQTSPGFVTPVAANLANATAVLVNGVGGNVILDGGFTPATVTTLSGNLGGNTILLSSLTLADWTANGDALAKAYISGAASATGLSSLFSGANLTAAALSFVNTPSTWQRVSDANIAAVNLINGNVIVSQDGLFNASSFLKLEFPALASLVPSSAQASEVVKVTYNGVTDYHFSFSAIPTGYVGTDGVSYTGRYDPVPVTIPEPTILALLGAGILGLAFSRRKSSSL